MTCPVFQSVLVDHIWMLLIFHRIFSEVPVLMLLYLIVGHHDGCFSCFRGLFQWVQYSAYDLTFKLSFFVVFSRMVHNKKLLRSSTLK